ncbi:MAG: saccharopine dehydrogenase C-terminal domain-containing protein [Planctomycetota bacterium]|nr:saccharopine dehydrogenase C-terminal domain-containing protein [Planctomycetota bacterium]
MASAIVLGAGMVGSVMAADMAAQGFDTAIADVRRENLDAASARAGGRVRAILADLSDASNVRRVVEPFDVVLGALSSRIGFRALRAVIDAGKPYADISFMGEDFTELDALAKDRGVTVVTDCGVAPGMSHILAAYGASMLSPCEAIEIYVGGLPRVRTWPYEYKAAFSPADVIEEYTRPARLVEHGAVVVRPALSEPELMDFEGVGTLEAFNTDGLRSLCRSLSVPFMKEKTLRYPGHIELMRVMRETGLFDETPVEVRGVRVVPRELTSALLFPKWTYGPGEEDLTVMRVTARGMRGRERVTLRWDLLDFYHRPTRATSMARSTAFPCTIVASLIASGRFASPGVNPPERLAAFPDLVRELLAHLETRGMRYVFSESAAAEAAGAVTWGT